ncbi:MAG: response regulator receiver protein [Ferruginibacter sp.]|nr:response regulator receiver protein [Ferruginibacter sp.]
MKRLHLVWVFLLPVFYLSSYAQGGNPKFTHLTTADGLSQSSVFAILKDYKGFMWFGTDEGLNKFDGYKFTVYKHDPEKRGSIIHNTVHGLLEDDSKNLWVVSADGVDRFDRINENFKHYTCNEKVIFRNIFQDSKKRFWLTSNGGFCLFDAAKSTFQFFKNNAHDSNSLRQNYVYQIAEDNNGDLLIATRYGLTRFNPETKKSEYYVNDPANRKSIGAGYIKAVYKDGKGNIWIGTQGSGVSLYNRTDNSFINYRHDPENKNSVALDDILSFTEAPGGILWIGTENGGISAFDYSKNHFDTYENNENDPSSVSGNSVYSLYKDNNGNIWVGTWSGGINFHAFFADKFSLYRKIPGNPNSLTNNIVLAVSNGPKNDIWIGTDGGGLSRFNPVTHQFTNYKNEKNNKNSIRNNYVLSISDYLPDVLALGFHRGGMDYFDVNKNVFIHHALTELNFNRLASPTINIVFYDRQQQQWVGCIDNGGVHQFDEKSHTLTNFYGERKKDTVFKDRSIFVMYETIGRQLWLGSDKGLDAYDQVTKISAHYQNEPGNKNSLVNNTVYSIKEDPIGNLWIGTSAGLSYFDKTTGSFTSYTEKDGLPNNTIWSIQQDRHGNLWISTNSGISRFNPTTRTFKNFTISDGLQNNAFKAKASCQSADGQMFFGGVNGFNTFYPDSIRYNDFVPPVYLTDFQLFNKPVGIGGQSPLQQSIDEVKEITLAYHSVFTLEFAALNFTHPEQNQYAYQLEGFDKEWNYVGDKRTATYTNLNPGTYRFKVKASNNDGVWNETGTTVKIIITPPFWLTWWFILIAALLFISSGIGFYLFRINIVKKQKLLLEQKVHEQTLQLVHSNEKEIKARLEAELARSESETARQQTWIANDELRIKNKELEQFAYVASHDLQEPLRTTAGFAELLLQQYKGKIDAKADKYLGFIYDASIRMKVLITDLLDFSKLGAEAQFKQINCNQLLKSMLEDIMAAVSEGGADIQYTDLPQINGSPTEIKLLFQNLVINAIKFRRKNIVPQIKIAARQTDGYWEFSVSDNGIGIEPQNKERIFEIFQRLNTRKEYEGSGIGLSHCKKIVELHKGNIWVVSTPGEGSTFYFTLPQ